MNYGLGDDSSDTITLSPDWRTGSAFQSFDPSTAILNVLPACSSITVPAGFVGPIQCDPTEGPVQYPASSNSPAAATSTCSLFGTAIPLPCWGIYTVGGLLVLGIVLSMSGGKRRR
jgi:hypothetical protein